MTSNKTAFDSLFQFLFIQQTPDTIPSNDFSTKKVISIVKYGNEFYDMAVNEFRLFNRVLIISYTSTLVHENMTFVVAIPLIITTNADFRRILFLENGKQIKELIL